MHTFFFKFEGVDSKDPLVAPSPEVLSKFWRHLPRLEFEAQENHAIGWAVRFCHFLRCSENPDLWTNFSKQRGKKALTRDPAEVGVDNTLNKLSSPIRVLKQNQTHCSTQYIKRTRTMYVLDSSDTFWNLVEMGFLKNGVDSNERVLAQPGKVTPNFRQRGWDLYVKRKRISSFCAILTCLDEVTDSQ